MTAMKHLFALCAFATTAEAQRITAAKPMPNPPAATGQWTAVADTGLFSSLNITLEERAGGSIGGEWQARLFGCTTLPSCLVAGAVIGSRTDATLSISLHPAVGAAFGAQFEATLTDSSTALGAMRLVGMGERVAGLSWTAIRRKRVP